MSTSTMIKVLSPLIKGLVLHLLSTGSAHFLTLGL